MVCSTVAFRAVLACLTRHYLPYFSTYFVTRMLITLQLMTMGCGISKNGRAVTPAKKSEPIPLAAWTTKTNGITTTPIIGLSNGHAKWDGPTTNGEAGGDRQLDPYGDDEPLTPATVAVPYTTESQNSSALSKQDSIRLFDLVGRVTTDTQTVPAETVDIGVNTKFTSQETSYTQTTPVPDSVQSARLVTQKGAHPLVDGSGIGKEGNDVVMTKLFELQQLLGPNVFTPTNGVAVSVPDGNRSRYIVVESNEGTFTVTRGAKEAKYDLDACETAAKSRLPMVMENSLGVSTYKQNYFHVIQFCRKPIIRVDRDDIACSESSDVSHDGSVDASQFPADLWDGDLERALTEISSHSRGRRRSRRPRVHASVQTDNDPITDEAPEFAARPPRIRKAQLIDGPYVFAHVDAHVLQTPETATTSLRNLVNYLIAPTENDLEKIRAFFVWIAHNISFDWRYAEQRLSVEEILEAKGGVCKDYCKLFSEMCRLCDIRVKKLHGFAKGFDFRPGHHFRPGEDITHAWSAVFVFGSWRLMDCTWGTGFTDTLGRFQRRFSEHYFLTDPDMFIWTHFPYDDLENNYSRWQLMDRQVSLDEFNSRPKLTSHFFDYNLRLKSHSGCPIVFSHKLDLQIQGISFMRYKFKFFPRSGTENNSYNKWVFCQFKRSRLNISFSITPPDAGEYYLKVYGRPEQEIKDTANAGLNVVANFLVECVKPTPSKYLRVYPPTEVPWGPTQAFYDAGLRLVNLRSSVISLPGGRWTIMFEKSQSLIVTQQMFDGNNEEVKLTATNFAYHETETELRFTVAPPSLGYYKFLLYGMLKPSERMKLKLPLIASFLLDVQTREVAVPMRIKKKKK